MFKEEALREIEKRKKEWEEKTIKASMKRFGIGENPNKFYSPEDVKDFDFLEKVGFPGEYPFTAGTYPTQIPGAGPVIGGGFLESGGGLTRAGRYSGYGTAEDTRDYYCKMQGLGREGGPNIAFDLPTQCGYDSDHPMARGEVGRTGVAIDTLRDFEVLYEAFTDDRDLDRIASDWTINAPANIIIAMYAVLAKKRGIPLDKLKGTPQNDILKEFAARGTYIFPPAPSMRMVRDTITFCTRHMPSMNVISICSGHIQEAGATHPQRLAFYFANAIAYVQLGIDAGLNVDDFLPRFTFLGFGGSMELLREVALWRAGRRMWARIVRDKFKAKDIRSYRMRMPGVGMSGYSSMTKQRPLNNLVRATFAGIAAALAGYPPSCEPPYDEALGLGWSLEAMQLSLDAARIIQYEGKLTEALDPLAGSYYIEAMTNQLEEEAWDILNKIEAMGGAVAAIEKGFVQKELARSAHQHQKEIETRQKIVVGVNAFLGENELEVTTNRLVPHPYDPERRTEAEEKQIAALTMVKRERDNEKVKATLKRLEEAAHDEKVNLICPIMEAVEAYATLGEICDVLRGVFGEYTEVSL
ncbi:MAG: methylmalonyl-CoA mutase family protein [Syntrophales bacterium]|nr:methylmalonyl-CoA mutase family protein [Syntrophales bacterium]